MRRSDVGEADRVLTIYTPTLGKLRVAARGIRKITSKLAGHLELFTHTALMLARGRSLDVITQSQTLWPYAALRADPQRLFCAYYTIELLDRLAEEEDPNPQVFELLVDSLRALDTSRNPMLVLRFYELRLLSYAGYRPHLQRCAACQEPLTEQAERFSPSLGGVLCPSCDAADRLALPMSLPCFKLLRYLQANDRDAVEALTISEGVSGEAEQLLRTYIRQQLERELKSTVFLDAVRRRVDVQGVTDGLR